MSDGEFFRFQELIYRRLGILYKEEKREMLQAKVSRQMRRLDIDRYGTYFEKIRQGRRTDPLWSSFVDDITIHTTNFFRERNHFDYLSRNVAEMTARNRRIADRREVRAWCAACSTGEEAYSLSIVLEEALGEGFSAKVLATDISRASVAKAMSGVYRREIAKDVGPSLLHRHFVPVAEGYRVRETLRRRIVFRLFNLAEPFPFRNGFDIIFCRNVMIYFPPEMQQSLLNKLYRALVPGGLLFIGHSESLIGKNHCFHYVQPTVYRR